MPSAPVVIWARRRPLLAAVTPRSRYLKKERRPSTSGAVAGVAYASLPGAWTAAPASVRAVVSFIMGDLLWARLGFGSTSDPSRVSATSAGWVGTPVLFIGG